MLCRVDDLLQGCSPLWESVHTTAVASGVVGPTAEAVRELEGIWGVGRATATKLAREYG